MIKRCTECKSYTLKDEHCSKKTVSPHPPKFSLEKEKKYGKYRRKGKL